MTRLEFHIQQQTLRVQRCVLEVEALKSKLLQAKLTVKSANNYLKELKKRNETP